MNIKWEPFLLFAATVFVSQTRAEVCALRRSIHVSTFCLSKFALIRCCAFRLTRTAMKLVAREGPHLLALLIFVSHWRVTVALRFASSLILQWIWLSAISHDCGAEPVEHGDGWCVRGRPVPTRLSGWSWHRPRPVTRESARPFASPLLLIDR